MSYHVNASHHPFPAPGQRFHGMCINQATVNQLLYGRKTLSTEAAIFGSSFPAIFAVQGYLATEYSQDHDPGRLDGGGAGFRHSFAERLKRHVTATGTPDGSVAHLCRFGLGDAVESVPKLVSRICTDFGGTAGTVVIKNLFGAKAEG